MGFLLLAVIALAGLAAYCMTPDERRRTARFIVDRTVAMIGAARRTPDDAFHALLLERTRRPFVAPALVCISVAVWIAMVFGAGTGTENLIRWGASYPPRTTNDEWWRLATYMFVHGSFVHLFATLIVLVPLGMYLERLVGHLALFTVYLASGIVAGVVGLWSMGATATIDGASGAVFGLLGLLLAVVIYGYVRAPRLPVSVEALKRLAIGLAVFAVCNLATDHLETPAELAAMATGLVAGAVLARNIVEEKPTAWRSAVVPAIAIVIALAAALPLRGIVDARPLLARIAAVEAQTAAEYNKAVDAYTHGRMSGKALAQVIQRNILPALEADRSRIDELRGVPLEQKPLLTDAKTYYDLREASWHQRVNGLLGSKMKLLRDAEQSERGALEALERLQHNVGAAPG